MATVICHMRYHPSDDALASATNSQEHFDFEFQGIGRQMSPEPTISEAVQENTTTTERT